MWRDIASAAMQQTWAISETYLEAMLMQAKMEIDIPRRIKLPKVQGDVAILPVYGSIHQRGSVWDGLFGGTNTIGLQNSFVRAIGNEKVGAVVFDVDSPGGTTAGIQELADVIWQGSNRGKPVVAVANSLMASAAYWIGSQVGSGKLQLVASPGADVGSIGVFRMHEDISEMLAEEGVKITFIQAGRYKTEANPFEPLSKEALEYHQTQVDAAYEDFVAAVARGRGVAKSVAREGFGQGRMMHADQAASVGLVDRVATLGRVLDELGAGSSARIMKAESQTIEDELCAAWDMEEALILPELPQAPDLTIRERALKLRFSA